MDYKEKYEQALERARQFSEKPYLEDSAGIVEYIFPELTESEDERTRKNIISWLKNMESQTIPINEYNSAIAWLEKQGEQKSEEVDNLHNYLYGKQKPADKVEPKFKVGEWIIFAENHNSIYQVERIDNYRYYLRHYLGGTLSVHFDNELIRKWTIQDAKDGDVLACNEEILLFKSYSVQGRISLYCWYNGQTGNFHSKEVVDTLKTTRNKICPATKEQRDLLFQKMKEAGYEWDAELKQLKKIEQKPVKVPKFKVGDLIQFNGMGHTRYTIKEMCGLSHYINMCNKRMDMSYTDANFELVEQKPVEWSEEEKKKIDNILNVLIDYKELEPEYFWLKSLRPQSQWKPSDEQMWALSTLANIPESASDTCKKTVQELLEELKKLREEDV